MHWWHCLKQIKRSHGSCCFIIVEQNDICITNNTRPSTASQPEQNACCNLSNCIWFVYSHAISIKIYLGHLHVWCAMIMLPVFLLVPSYYPSSVANMQLSMVFTNSSWNLQILEWTCFETCSLTDPNTITPKTDRFTCSHTCYVNKRFYIFIMTVFLRKITSGDYESSHDGSL